MTPPPRNPRVLVLLSTYNGARYLADQIDSILDQESVQVTLLVRDDGSQDATPDILHAYRANDPRVRICRGGVNLGPAHSFLDLLFHAGPGYDAIAFADQDDVWLPDKLARAARALGREDAGSPLGYCAGLTLTDAALNPIGDTPTWRRPPAFGNALVENVAIGCTLAINDAARRILVAPGERPDVPMHDWLVYQVVSGSGRMLYDPRPVLLYRQHARNAIGAGPNRLVRLTRAARNVRAGDAGRRTHRQNRELARLYADSLRPEARRLLEKFLTRPNGRIRLALDPAIYRQWPLDDLAMRLLVLSGKL